MTCYHNNSRCGVAPVSSTDKFRDLAYLISKISAQIMQPSYGTFWLDSSLVIPAGAPVIFNNIGPTTSDITLTNNATYTGPGGVGSVSGQTTITVATAGLYQISYKLFYAFEIGPDTNTNVNPGSALVINNQATIPQPAVDGYSLPFNNTGGETMYVALPQTSIYQVYLAAGSTIQLTNYSNDQTLTNGQTSAANLYLFRIA